MASSKKGKAPAFVFDAVCHIFNFDPKNALGQPGQMFNEHLYAFHQLLTRAGRTDPEPRTVHAGMERR